jgi:hypothetical protein
MSENINKIKDRNEAIFIIDVMNVVINTSNGEKNYCYKRLEKMYLEIRKLGRPIMFIPKYLEEKIDQILPFKEFRTVHCDEIIEFESYNGIDNDKWMIDFAKNQDSYIVTNDRFKNHNRKRIKRKLLPFLFKDFENSLILILPWRDDFLPN